MTAVLNLYLSDLIAWAGLAVAIGTLVWALNGLYTIAVNGWHAWRTRRALNALWDDSTIGAGGFPPPVGRRAGTTAATSAGDSRPFDWQRPA